MVSTDSSPPRTTRRAFERAVIQARRCALRPRAICIVVSTDPLSMLAPHVSALRLFFSLAFVAWTVALVGFAVYVLRLPCEGFGCTGIGIAWGAWGAALVPTLAVGAVLRASLPAATRVRAAVSWGLGALLALGVMLVLNWLVQRAV